MVSMKLEESEKGTGAEVSMDSPDYPYGLSITLEKESLAKLGKSAADYKMGDKVAISAVAHVKSISSSQYEDGGNHESVTLQITEMDCGNNSKDKDGDRASRLYGGSDGDY